MSTPERRIRTVRVRKRVSVDSQDPSQTLLKRTRVVKLMRCASAALPEAIEDDFVLENEPDARAFLRVALPDSQEAFLGPRYQAEGKLVPYSIIGPVDLFEKQHTSDMKTGVISEDKSKTDRRAVFIGIRKPMKPPTTTPEQNLQGKLLKIEEGKRKDAEVEAKRKATLPLGVRIVEDRQKRCLQQFERTTRSWTALSSGLSHRVGKSPSSLLHNQAQTFRERIEDMDYLDRAVSAEEKAGAQVWYMTLRADSQATGRGSFLPVGSLFSGIYAHVKERTNSAEALIRRPLAPKTPLEPSKFTRTFRDYPYFQRRFKDEDSRRPLRPVQTTAPDSLWLQGKGKFEEEMKVLRSLGTEVLRVELLKSGELTEEVLAEQYDIQYRY